MKKLTNQSGFTLLELLIYIGIFSIIIGAVVGLAVLTSAQKINSQATAEVNYQGEAAMALIVQTVHQATSISGPAAGTSASSLTLAMPTSAANPTVFDANADTVTTHLRISEGSTPTTNYLTNSHVSVSNLTFSNESLLSTKGSVQIQFTLTYRTNSARQELTVSKTFYGAATIP